MKLNMKFRNLPSDAYMIYEECKATLFNDASSRNNTPKHEAPLCGARILIVIIFIMGPEGEGGGVRTPRTPSLDPPLGPVPPALFCVCVWGGGGGGGGGGGRQFLDNATMINYMKFYLIPEILF